MGTINEVHLGCSVWTHLSSSTPRSGLTIGTGIITCLALQWYLVGLFVSRLQAQDQREGIFLIPLAWKFWKALESPGNQLHECRIKNGTMSVCSGKGFTFQLRFHLALGIPSLPSVEDCCGSLASVASTCSLTEYLLSGISVTDYALWVQPLSSAHLHSYGERQTNKETICQFRLW